MKPKQHDIFISYASEDKDSVVEPLVRSLVSIGALSMWYDEIMIGPFESIKAAIDLGLRRSLYVVAIVSPSYLGKNWPEREFTAALHSAKRILPIWHGLDAKHIRKLGPTMLDTKALRTSDGSDTLAEKIAGVLLQDKKTFFHKNRTSREEKELFWEMVNLYIHDYLGTLPGDVDQQMSTLDEKLVRDGKPVWRRHVENEIAINHELLSILRKEWHYLSPSDFVIAAVCLMKEYCAEDHWVPPTEGRAEVLERIGAYKARSKRKKNGR